MTLILQVTYHARGASSSSRFGCLISQTTDYASLYHGDRGIIFLEEQLLLQHLGIKDEIACRGTATQTKRNPNPPPLKIVAPLMTRSEMGSS